MAKKNSLKLAPYVAHKISTWKYDDALEPDYSRYNDPSYSYQDAHAAWLASGVENIEFEGHTLIEYTYGSTGEQASHGKEPIDWRPNEPFDAELTIKYLERGRSAARFWFVDETNKVYYPFFGQTLVDMLEVSNMIQGKVKGTWIVVKKGANYGIELYVP